MEVKNIYARLYDERGPIVRVFSDDGKIAKVKYVILDDKYRLADGKPDVLDLDVTRLVYFTPEENNDKNVETLLFVSYKSKNPTIGGARKSRKTRKSKKARKARKTRKH